MATLEFWKLKAEQYALAVINTLNSHVIMMTGHFCCASMHAFVRSLVEVLSYGHNSIVVARCTIPHPPPACGWLVMVVMVCVCVCV